MYLIVGLGNPGKKYEKTRHNIGFLIVSLLAKKYNITNINNEFDALTGRGEVAGDGILLVQPLTYMNRSGIAVKKIVNNYKISLDKLLIIYDDMDIPVGNIRLKNNGSSGGHNGMNSIITKLGVAEFPRLRIGIGHPPEEIEVTDYVLGFFAGEDKKLIADAANKAVSAVDLFLKDSLSQAMNKYN